MNALVGACRAAAVGMEALAGCLVFAMMLLTVSDVALRQFGRPIFGSFELIALMGAAVVGLSMPKTSLEHGHVQVDLLATGRSASTRRIVASLTRLLGAALFAALTWFLLAKAAEQRDSGLVSGILQLPQHYLVYALAACAMLQCLTLMLQLAMLWHPDAPR